jgi:hypothetical protein
MAGLLFIVCIPTSKQEVNLNESSQGKNVSSVTLNEDFIQQFSDRKSESLHSLRKAISASDSLYETDDTSISFVSKTPKQSTATINSDTTLDGNDTDHKRTDSRSDRPCEVAVKIEESRSNEELTKVVTKKNASERGKEILESVMPMEKVSWNKSINMSLESDINV